MSYRSWVCTPFYNFSLQTSYLLIILQYFQNFWIDCKYHLSQLWRKNTRRDDALVYIPGPRDPSLPVRLRLPQILVFQVGFPSVRLAPFFRRAMHWRTSRAHTPGLLVQIQPWRTHSGGFSNDCSSPQTGEGYFRMHFAEATFSLLAWFWAQSTLPTSAVWAGILQIVPSLKFAVPRPGRGLFARDSILLACI